VKIFSGKGLVGSCFMQSWELEFAKEELSQRGEPQEILPGLFLGSLACTQDNFLEKLNSLHITHILSVGGTSGRSGDPNYEGKRLELVGVDDLPNYNLFQHFDQCCAFIDNAFKDEGKVLVHCFHGKSRSAAIVAAYLIYKEKCTPDQAIHKIQEQRPVANPNHGFRKQLNNFYIKASLSVAKDTCLLRIK